MKTILLVFFLLFLIYLFWTISRFTSDDTIDILNYKETGSDLEFKKKVQLIRNPETDVKLEPLGCYYNLEEQFFYRKINPFAKVKEFNSLYVVKDSATFKDLLIEVSNNGFGDYAKKLGNDLNKLSLQQLACLALFAGYNYISVYKNNESEYGKIFLTYSPPMVKHNNTGSFTPKEFKDYTLKPELSSSECGYHCSDSSKMCGSNNYPNIKNTPRFAVYRITESV